MTDKIIIDGYNLCWKLQDTRGFMPDQLEEARNTLLRLLKVLYGQKCTRVIVVFDGQPGILSENKSGGNIQFRFSRAPQNADQLIIDLLRKQQHPNQWTVVSSDEEVLRKAAACEAHRETSEQFSRRLARKREETAERDKKNPHLSREELDFWLGQFSDDEV